MSWGDIAAGIGKSLIDNGDGTYSVRSNTSVSLSSSDIQIGAVELKDSTTTNRASIDASGQVAVVDGAVKTAVEIMDDWDESDRAKVNLVVGQAGITAGAGAVAANTPRTTLASDDPAVAALQIMDDWDETDRAKVNIIAGQAGVTAGAGAVAANTPRMTLASDDPAVASLATIAGDTTDIEAAVELIDDTVFTDDAAFTPGTSKGLAIGMQADETSADSVDEGDFGVPRMTLDRRQRVANKSIEGPGEPTIDSYTHAAISAAVTTADQSVVAAPGASKQIWVYGINFVTAAAGTVSFQDEDNTAISGVMSFAANGGMAVSPSGNFSMPLWKVATNKALEVDTASGADAKGWISYAIVSV